jgi:hypothetical protein
MVVTRPYWSRIVDTWPRSSYVKNVRPPAESATEVRFPRSSNSWRSVLPSGRTTQVSSPRAS